MREMPNFKEPSPIPWNTNTMVAVIHPRPRMRPKRHLRWNKFCFRPHTNSPIWILLPFIVGTNRHVAPHLRLDHLSGGLVENLADPPRGGMPQFVSIERNDPSSAMGRRPSSHQSYFCTLIVSIEPIF